MRRAMVLGSVLASFTVERFSLDRLRDLAPEEIRARYSEARRLAHFDDLELDLFNGVYRGLTPLRPGGYHPRASRGDASRMRIGILSDIHSNLEALTEVLAARRS